ncbi:MAG: peptidase M14 family protein [Acidobacteria bacterium]|nr:peptidase M14 family protein [Acidobacteriota bacterium]
MKGKARVSHLVPLVLALIALLGSGLSIQPIAAQGKTAAAATVTSPEKFFGFQLGSDRKIARWDRIVEYYRLLAKESSKVKVVDMGPSTMGNPFLLVIISSPANLAKLERLREVNLRISDPRGVPEAEIKKLVGEGKAVICQSMSLHASEIGGTQMAPELAFDLLTRPDEETQRILDNVVFLMVPSFNPDGAIMVADWYNKTVGTEYEGTSLPWLYHKYAGHDDNRDAFQTNLIESVYMAKILFTDWIPQAYVDHHHMGSYGARIYVPPYAEPVRPLADPLIWREHSWYGAHIAYKEEEAGLSGILNMAQYSGWGHFGFHWITPFHNIAGMLTESASARLATPLYIHPDQLQGGARGLPAYEQQTTFPDPWPGGWWRLRDIVDRQKVSAWATLDLAARNKETVLWNAYLKAKRQTERGAQGKPAAYVIPASQHDPLTATKLVNKLLVQGIEIRHAPKGFTAGGGTTYGPGSFVVPLAQPKMGLIRYLLGRTFYPDNTYTRDSDGTPIRPYDMATDTMFEFMGVRVDPLDETVEAPLEKISAVKCLGNVGKGAFGYVFDGRLNDSFRVVNLLADKGVAMRRVDKAGDGLRPGDFIVAAGSEAILANVGIETGVDFTALRAEVKQPTHEVKRQRIGMYQRYAGGNMDEGWTRLLLEQFLFPYASLMDAEIKKGNLNAKYDVIIVPDDSTAAITGERSTAPGGGGGRSTEATPAEYRSGLGTDGVEALKAFVQKGGTLVALGQASTFAIEKFGLPVRNVVSGRTSKEFWCPGSTLRVKFDAGNPLAYGMPSEGLVVYLGGNPAFEIVPSSFNEQYATVVTYADRDLLQSGWLIGEETLAKKAGMVAAKFGEGRVVLIGFRTQHRAQTHGTYKLLFNALVK